MRLVLPGEADTAVQLHRLGRHRPQRLQRLRERQRPRTGLGRTVRSHRSLGPGPTTARRPGRVVRRRARRLERHIQIGEPVLDRLEGTDGPAELLALLDVGDGSGQRRIGRADRLGSQRRGRRRPGRGERPGHRRLVTVPLPQQLRRHLPQFEARLRTGLVQRGLPGPQQTGHAGVRTAPGVRSVRRAGRRRPYEKEQGTAAGEPSGVRGHHQHVRGVPVQHLSGLPVQPPRAVLHPRLDAAGPAAARPVAVVRPGQGQCGGELPARYGERSGQLSGGQGRQQCGALAFASERENQRRGQRGGGDQRRGEYGAAGLLAGQGQFGGPAAHPAVCGGQRQAGQAEPAGELPPQLLVVPGWGAYRRLDLVRTTALEQQLAQRTADFVLLLGERGIHRRAPPGRATTPVRCDGPPLQT